MTKYRTIHKNTRAEKSTEAGSHSKNGNGTAKPESGGKSKHPMLSDKPDPESSHNMGEARAVKDALCEQLARIGKAFASPKRVELLEMLCQAPKHVEALAEETGNSIAVTSQHLRILYAARLVETERRGVQIIYRIADEEVSRFIGRFRMLAAKRLAEVDRLANEYAGSRDEFMPVDAHELAAKLRKKEAIVIDVRPEDEYRAAHLPGARSIPLDQIEKRLAELPSDGEIVAYCRGPFCLLASEAVRRLQEHGFNARRLAMGVAEWLDAGYKLEKA